MFWSNETFLHRSEFFTRSSLSFLGRRFRSLKCLMRAARREGESPVEPFRTCLLFKCESYSLSFICLHPSISPFRVAFEHYNLSPQPPMHESSPRSHSKLAKNYLLHHSFCLHPASVEWSYFWAALPRVPYIQHYSSLHSVLCLLVHQKCEFPAVIVHDTPGNLRHPKPTIDIVKSVDKPPGAL